MAAMATETEPTNDAVPTTHDAGAVDGPRADVDDAATARRRAADGRSDGARGRVRRRPWATALWLGLVVVVGRAANAEAAVPCEERRNLSRCVRNPDCRWSFAEDRCVVDGTRRPTRRPTTRRPSRRPTTSRPSRRPSRRPSGAAPSTEGPTGPPTDEPARPTVRPTGRPTEQPTSKPSNEPTDQPSARPSPAPTKSPTDRPTAAPSESPSAGPTPPPTRRPTKRPSESPTRSPSGSPTRSPSRAPSDPPTDPPSASPSAPPTRRPTDSPTRSPTLSPTLSARPTPLIWPSASPTASSSPTASPTYLPSAVPSASPTASPSSTEPTSGPSTPGTTFGPTAPAPISSETTTSGPTGSPATGSPATDPSREYAVPSAMILRGAADDLLDPGAIQSWLRTTRARIRDGTREIAGRGGGRGRSPRTTVRFDGQEAFDARRRTSGRRNQYDGRLRRLRSSSIKIYFTVAVAFDPAEEGGGWTPREAVAAGFRTASQREGYLDALRAADDAAFGNLEGMALEVDGTLIPPRPDGPAVIPEAGLPNTTPQVQTGDAQPLYYILGGLAGGAIVALVAGGLLHRYRRKPATSPPPPPPATPPTKRLPQDTPTVVNVTVASEASPPRGAPRPRPPSTAPTFSDTVTPVLTVESREGEDDVSTLEIPYFPPRFPGVAAADADDPLAESTVGASIMSSEHQGYVWDMGRERLDTADRSTVAGGTNVYMEDNHTLEGIYRTPASSYEEGPEGSNFQCLTVVAPPGRLGINFDLRTGNMPLVLAIEASSPVHGQVNVGDLVVSVDEIDCGGLSAVQVSRLISGRSRNAARRLVLLRGSGSC